MTDEKHFHGSPNPNSMFVTAEVLLAHYLRHDQKLEVVLQLVKLINIKVTKLMTTQAELATQLNDISTQLGTVSDQVSTVKTEVAKVGTETQGLQTQVQTLTDALNNQGAISPEVQTALDGLKAKAAAVAEGVGAVAASIQAVDDLVPDVTPPPAAGGTDAGAGAPAQS